MKILKEKVLHFQNPAISFIPSNGALSMPMQMKPVIPQDQASLASNGSSILKSVSLYFIWVHVVSYTRRFDYDNDDDDFIAYLT